jgi:DNA-directed RNA polymerase specialized sigma24 family protein
VTNALFNASPAAVRAALLEVSSKLREPVVLRDLLGMSYREVSYEL